MIWTKLAFLKTCGGLNSAGCESLDDAAAMALEAMARSADAIDNGFIVGNEWKGRSLICARPVLQI